MREAGRRWASRRDSGMVGEEGKGYWGGLPADHTHAPLPRFLTLVHRLPSRSHQLGVWFHGHHAPTHLPCPAGAGEKPPDVQGTKPLLVSCFPSPRRPFQTFLISQSRWPDSGGDIPVSGSHLPQEESPPPALHPSPSSSPQAPPPLLLQNLLRPFRSTDPSQKYSGLLSSVTRPGLTHSLATPECFHLISQQVFCVCLLCTRPFGI